MKNRRSTLRRLATLSLIPLSSLAISGARFHGNRRIVAAGAPATLSKPDPATQGRVLQSYGKLPLAFEANQGQTDLRAKFLSRGAGYTLFLTGDEAVLAMRGPEVRGQTTVKAGTRKSKFETRDDRPLPVAGGGSSHGQRLSHRGFLQIGQDPRLGKRQPWLPSRVPNPESRTPAVLAMKLVGANPQARVEGADELPGKSNYFIGNDPKKWRTNVPTYAKVKYASVYPGVDLVYYGNQGQLEYDFVVAPGADPKAITLAVAPGFSPASGNAALKGGAAVAPASSRHGAARARPERGEGMAALRLDRNGDLVVRITGGEVRFHKPVVYQPAADNRRPATAVDGRYRLAGHHVTFSLGSYDRTKPLVIDPALSYSTYLDGSGYAVGQGIAVDASGDAYVTGYTDSIDFPITPGAFQTACGGGCSGNTSDAFVTKLNSSGTALVYSTFLGGSNTDLGFGIAVDTSGNAYVTGSTYSSDFPTTPGAFDPTCSTCVQNNGDAFVAKLNSTGSALIYSTYLGGSSDERGFAIAVDTSGNAYVTGYTNSTDFPVTPGTFQPTSGGYSDAYVTKLNPTASALIYSTYLGGSSSDVAYGIAVDASGNTYVAGVTYSSDFPSTPGAFDTTCGTDGTCNGGFNPDAYVTKLNPTGSALVYSTYLGGSGGDVAYGASIDSSGNAYLTGATNSSDFPTTPGSFQPTGGGAGDAFVTKLNPTGSALVYSTYLSGSSQEIGYGVAVDSSGDAYVTGNTFSSDFPITPGAFQPVFGGGLYDAFVSKLNPTGSALAYSTYLGGSGNDQGSGIAVDGSANAYFTGSTTSIDFPITPGAFQTNCGGGCVGGSGDAFVARFVFVVDLSPSTLNFGNQTVGTSSATQSATLSNGSTTALSITGISVTGGNSGDFAQTNTCGSSLAAGASCTISVTFTPLATGTRTAAITVTDNAPNSPQTASLTGVGVLPAVTFSPTGLTFPVQLVFTSSKAQTVTLSNTGLGILTITSIALTGEFTQTNTCGTSVAPGASCSISVKFTPKTKGTLTGTLSVTDNAPGSPQTVSLMGTGTYVQLVPASVNFGTQPVGTKSLPRKITLTNKGSVAVSISKISITGTDPGDFAETNTCGGSVAGGASCFITVTFTPLVKGTRAASVSVSDNGGGSPQTVPLTGTGT